MLSSSELGDHTSNSVILGARAAYRACDVISEALMVLRPDHGILGSKFGSPKRDFQPPATGPMVAEALGAEFSNAPYQILRVGRSALGALGSGRVR
jgi:hypothetical protein